MLSKIYTWLLEQYWVRSTSISDIFDVYWTSLLFVRLFIYNKNMLGLSLGYVKYINFSLVKFICFYSEI